MTKNDMQNTLDSITEDMKMQNVAEARVVINNLKEVLLKNMVQIENNDYEIKIQKQEIENVREINRSQIANMNDNAKLRLYYQHKLLKFLRDS